MKITKSELRRIISEEVERIFEEEIEEGFLDPVKKMFGMRTTAKTWPDTLEKVKKFWPNKGDVIQVPFVNNNILLTAVSVLESSTDKRLKLKLDINNPRGNDVEAVLDTFLLPKGGGKIVSKLEVLSLGEFKWTLNNIDMNSADIVSHITDIFNVMQSLQDGTQYLFAPPPRRTQDRYAFDTDEELWDALKTLGSNANLNSKNYSGELLQAS